MITTLKEFKIMCEDYEHNLDKKTTPEQDELKDKILNPVNSIKNFAEISDDITDDLLDKEDQEENKEELKIIKNNLDRISKNSERIFNYVNNKK